MTEDTLIAIILALSIFAILMQVYFYAWSAGYEQCIKDKEQI
jgi:hypothetical protein